MVETKDRSSPLHYKDQLAREFQKRIEEKGLGLSQVVGELLALPFGVPKELINYTQEPNYEYWGPTRIKWGDGRDGINFSGTSGPQFPIEGLKLGLMNAIDFRKSGTMDNLAVYLIPYIHFEKPELIPSDLPEEAKKQGIVGVHFLLLTRYQVDDLKKLIGITEEDKIKYASRQFKEALRRFV